MANSAMDIMKSLMTEQSPEALLADAIDLDQLIVLEVELLMRRFPEGMEFAMAFNSVIDKAMRNAQAIRRAQELLKQDDQEEVLLLERA
jgi:hypothetical protein